jgi:hypothetical protein
VEGRRNPREFLYVIFGTDERVDSMRVPTRLSYRVATGLGSSFSAGIFAPARRIDTLQAVHGVRRQVDYAFARTLHAPVVVGGMQALHLLVVGLNQSQWPSLVPRPSSTYELAASADRIRYARLRPVLLTGADFGALTWDSERPVILTRTALGEGTRSAEAGAAWISGRRQLRFYYADGVALTTRTLTQP